MIVRQTAWADADASALRAAQRAEIDERYGTPDSEPGPAPSAADILVFFVAYSDDGTPLGCGGLREVASADGLDAAEGEIKRMYVVPAARGTGVSTAILAELEGFALARGWPRLVLETGTEQPDAMRFYEREGYTRIPNFGYYADAPLSLCYEKPLVPIDPADATICEGCE